jgi:hypothetical protein
MLSVADVHHHNTIFMDDFFGLWASSASASKLVLDAFGMAIITDNPAELDAPQDR